MQLRRYCAKLRLNGGSGTPWPEVAQMVQAVENEIALNQSSSSGDEPEAAQKSTFVESE